MNKIAHRHNSARHAMNHHDTRWLDRAVGNLVAENEESIGGASPSAFAILPMPWVCDSCQSPANAQQALYLLASQQAEIAVRAVQGRRQWLFARGVHLWN